MVEVVFSYNFRGYSAMKVNTRSVHKLQLGIPQAQVICFLLLDFGFMQVEHQSALWILLAQ